MGIAALCLVVALQLMVPSVSVCQQAAADLLKQSQAEKDPIKRISLLDEALKNASANSKTLASLFFTRGMAHKDMKDCAHAVDDFRSALVHAPNTLQTLLEKAECLITLGQLDEASRVLEAALLTGPGMGRAYVLKGMIYEKEGAIAKAEDEYTRALNYEPDLTLALEMRAKALVRGGKPRKALEDINALVRLRPNEPEAILTRARIHAKLEEYVPALADYTKVESLLPRDDRVLKEKVLVYFRTGQPQKALDSLSGYKSDRTDDTAILILRARAHILLKNYPSARQALKSALAREPLNPAAHLYAGVVMARSQDTDGALAGFNRAIELDSTLVEAYKERARVFLELKETVRAAVDLTAAADLDPSDDEVFPLRGLTLMKRLLYDAAVDDFTRALGNLPGEPRILYDRAVAYLSKDEPKPALEDLNALLKAKPNAAKAISLRGVSHFLLGNVSQAREDFDKAVTAGPTDPQIRNNRGFFHYKVGNYKAAQKDFETALKLDPGYVNASYNLKLTTERDALVSSASEDSARSEAAVQSGEKASSEPR
jgi:tetratricopeptide (TPR) repeat protein